MVLYESRVCLGGGTIATHQAQDG
ncbi:MAG: hypothetical protein IPK39_12495 [Sulfuritalea sp.]|nr:hypothetical protein [Sulfuritalea sp.]